MSILGLDIQLETVLIGIIAGLAYAVLAAGIVLVYRATGVVNFAQGEMATFTTYGVWQLSAWGVPIWGAIAVVIPVAFVLGVVVFAVAVRPVAGRSDLTIVTLTLGLALGFNEAAAGSRSH